MGEFEMGDKAICVSAFAGGQKYLEAIRDTMLIRVTGCAPDLRDVATVAQTIDLNAFKNTSSQQRCDVYYDENFGGCQGLYRSRRD